MSLTDPKHVPVLRRFGFYDNQYNDIYPNIHNNVNCSQMPNRYAFHSQHNDTFAAREDCDDFIEKV